MGDRYEFNDICLNCLREIRCYYADSCGVTEVTCPYCKEKFEIIMDFKLVEKSGK